MATVLSMQSFCKILLFSSFFLLGLTKGEQYVRSKGERIVGGELVRNKTEFPWMAHLTLRGIDGQDYLCGGSVIDPSTILTAGHCVTGIISATIVTGALRPANANEEGHQSRTSSQIIQHPNYQTLDGAPVNDVAVIKFSPPLNITSYVQRIQLADNSVPDDAGIEVTTIGWGVTAEGSPFISEELRKVKVAIVDTTACREIYFDLEAVSNNTLCAAAPGKDSCQGDSGGPLICTVGDTPFVCGVVSFGIGCATDFFPGVYARVRNYRSWIMENLTPTTTTTTAPSTTTITTSTPTTTTTIAPSTAPTTTASTTVTTTQKSNASMYSASSALMLIFISIISCINFL